MHKNNQRIQHNGKSTVKSSSSYDEFIVPEDPPHAFSLVLVVWIAWLIVSGIARLFISSKEVIVNIVSGFKLVAQFIAVLYAEAREVMAHRRHADHSDDVFFRALFPYSTLYRLVWFVVGAVLLLIPLAAFQISIEGYAAHAAIRRDLLDGYSALEVGAQSLMRFDIHQAQFQTRKAQSSFRHARESLTAFDGAFITAVTVIPYIGDRIRAADDLSSAGEHISAALLECIEVADELSQEHAVNTSYLTAIKELTPILDLLSDDIYKALIHSESIPESLIPEQFRTRFIEGKQALRAVYGGIGVVRNAADHITDALGVSTLRRYLVLFQNNAELRASGGFIGSFALIDVAHGKIIDVEIPSGGPYDLRGSLRKKMPPPRPLQIIAEQWEFQDANWYADFPATAQQILWFYEASGGPSVDGVIAVNASLIPRLMSITGSIALDAYDMTLTQENVLDELQKEVELRYDRTKNAPKKIISDLFPLIMDRLGSQDVDRSLQIITLLIEAIQRKELQFYFTDNEVQTLLHSVGIDGAQIIPEPDYLSIIDSNIGGAKTDSVITASAQRTVTVNRDGTIDAKLTVTRSHDGTKGELFTGVANNDYMRIYLPRGSRVFDADGFSLISDSVFKQPSVDAREYDTFITESDRMVYEDYHLESWNERAYSVFGGWIITQPSETKSITLSYRLPFRLQDLPSENGDLVWKMPLQRQSGSRILSLSLTYHIPRTFAVQGFSSGSLSVIAPSPILSVKADPFQSDGNLIIRLKPR